MSNKLLLMACLVGGFALCNQAMSASARPAAVAVAAEINACTLLSAAEISQAIGLPVDEGRRQDEGLQSNGSYSSACVWVIRHNEPATPNPAAPLGGRSFVILNAIQWPVGSGLARTFLEAFHEAAANGEIPSKPLPRKFGDEALWWGDGLAVRRGDVSFGISVFIPGPKAIPPMKSEEALAPYILRRLDARGGPARAG